MNLDIKETKFGDIILWNKTNKKFVAVRNYYKLSNALKASNFEICCIALGNGSFVCLKEKYRSYTWYEAMEEAKVYKGTAPIKSYLPSIIELESFYPFIGEFNNKIEKLQSLGIDCEKIRLCHYWSSTEYSSTNARNLYTRNGNVINYYKNNYFYVRAFVAF